MYEQLGYKAFGMPGKLAASISITMQNIGGERTWHFDSKGRTCVQKSYAIMIEPLLPTRVYSTS